jgi:putative transposase
MGRKLTPLILTERQYKLLLEISHKRSTSKQEQERISIVLKSSQGESQTQIAGDLNLDYETVRLWRNRWIENYALLTKYEQGIADTGVPDHKLVKKMLLLLKDAPRKGTVRKFNSEQDDLLVALACESPTDYGLIRTNWTHETLSEVAVSKGIFQKISARTVGKLLKKKNYSLTKTNIGSSRASPIGMNSSPEWL